jgi:predicted acyl esterase
MRPHPLLVVSTALLLGHGLGAQPPQRPPSYPALPSETPSTFEPVTTSFDYERREVMIPMRDGVRLHTVVLVPKGARNAPILLTRTPYDARR